MHGVRKERNWWGLSEWAEDSTKNSQMDPGSPEAWGVSRKPWLDLGVLSRIQLVRDWYSIALGKKVIRSNAVLIEKTKQKQNKKNLALKGLIWSYLGKSKEIWKAKFSSNLEKVIELNSSIEYEIHQHDRKMYKIKGCAKEPSILQNMNFIYLSVFCRILSRESGCFGT